MLNRRQRREQRVERAVVSCWKSKGGCGAAGWKPAKQQIGNLRYEG